jgi:hypothetical protein
MARPRFPSGASNIIGRHLNPSAWEYDAWSREVADRLQEARCAAQDMMRDDPCRAHKIIAEWRAKSLEEKAAAIRKRTNS